MENVISKGDKESTLAGLILAGGKSSRMGRDKVTLEIDGKSLVQHQVDLLSSLLSDLVFSGPGAASVQGLWIPDRLRGLGPMGGLDAAFARFPEKAFLVLPVDLYPVDQKVLDKLMSARDPSCPATAIQCEGRIEPFPCILEPGISPTIQSQIKAGELSVISLLKKVKVHWIEFRPSWRNLNEPGDLAGL